MTLIIEDLSPIFFHSRAADADCTRLGRRQRVLVHGDNQYIWTHMVSK